MYFIHTLFLRCHVDLSVLLSLFTCPLASFRSQTRYNMSPGLTEINLCVCACVCVFRWS